MQLTVNGHVAYAYTGGKPFDPALPCVVFIHGALHDHSVWTLLARWCAHHGYGVLAVDQPGHGRSGGMPLTSVEALADWVIALLDAAGVQQAAVVGHSLGSLIALETAARAPERVNRLMMIATAFPMKVSEALLNTAREEPLKAIDMVNAFSHSTIGAKPAYPGPGSWLHGGNRALMRRLQAAQTEVNLFENDFRVCDGYAGGSQAVERVQCPVTVVLAERDAMTAPKSGRALAQALKARVVPVPAGHALMQEAPDAVLGALKLALGNG
jgi:pimeloyl-ACP methyl ester carboxylesterase